MTEIDPNADLMAMDADTMEGEALAVAVARARGYRWYQTRHMKPSLLFLQHPDRPQMPGYLQWDGKEYMRPADDAYRYIPRPDRDPAAAVELLCEMAERWRDASVDVTCDHEERGADVMAAVGFSKWPVEPRVFVKGKPTPENIRLAITRAYLKAWQAETREKEANGGNV
jgi:hypothetical protein